MKPNRNYWRAWLPASVGMVLAMSLAGCGGGEEANLPPAKVQPVTAYGLTLDETATPQQVAFVLLRSLADDVLAAQDQPARPADQKKANLITWSVAATNEIERRLLLGLREAAKDPNRVSSLGKDRDKEIYHVVNLWAPIVAYYVHSIDADAQTAVARMQTINSLDGRGIHVQYEVWPVASRPDADRRQRIDVELVKEKDSANGKDYWRVARVGYAPPPGAGSASRPARASGARPATRPVATTQPAVAN